MKYLILIFFVFFFSPVYALTLTLHDTPTAVYFSPNGGAQQALVDAIDNAKRSVYVQAYGLSNRTIIKSLGDAARRGVVVEIIQDGSAHEKLPWAADYLRHAGARVFFDKAHAIAHNKIMVIDTTTVATGSFNFTTAAEKRNTENLLIIKDKRLAKLYMDNWNMHRHHSTK